MAKFIFREGQRVIHCEDAHALEDTLDILDRRRGTEACTERKPTVENFAAEVSVYAHEVLLVVNEHIHPYGRERKNLGTALRAGPVRSRLGNELCKELSFIAEGSDAYRHLSSSDMRFTVASLRHFAE